MAVSSDFQRIAFHKNLKLLSEYMVEGFLVGLHKSPLRGFSSEFLEHKIYNTGESTRYVDWKLYAKSGRLYTKQFQEETNLRAHIILDNSSSMYFPNPEFSLENPNKIGFSIIAIAALMNLLKRQRDAVGMSIYSDTYEFYAPEKANNRHHQELMDNLISAAQKQPQQKKKTQTDLYLRQIAEKLHQRSFVLLFTDMFQPETDETKIFEALRYFKYKKHNVVLFHVIDKAKEVDLHYQNTPQCFVDLETGEAINSFNDVQKQYKASVESYFHRLKLKCLQYNIEYVKADIAKGVNPVLQSFLVKRQNFI